MGQKIYYYQAPTGFPDKAEYWVNTGALLNRMNFGLALATQRIPGVRVNLSGLTQPAVTGNAATPGQMMGLHIGSPEFQRR